MQLVEFFDASGMKDDWNSRKNVEFQTQFSWMETNSRLCTYCLAFEWIWIMSQKHFLNSIKFGFVDGVESSQILCNVFSDEDE